MAVMAWRFITTGGIEMLRAHARHPEAGAQLVQDPVCGMTVDPATADQPSEFGGSTYYFCSPGCRAKFGEDPARYTSEMAPGEHAGNLCRAHVLASRPGEEMA